MGKDAELSKPTISSPVVIFNLKKQVFIEYVYRSQHHFLMSKDFVAKESMLFLSFLVFSDLHGSTYTVSSSIFSTFLF